MIQNAFESKFVFPYNERGFRMCTEVLFPFQPRIPTWNHLHGLRSHMPTGQETTGEPIRTVLNGTVTEYGNDTCITFNDERSMRRSGPGSMANMRMIDSRRSD